MRIIVAGFSFEANSFAKPRTSDISDIVTLTGKQLHAAHADGTSTISGYIRYAAEHPGFDLDLLGFSRLTPRAPIAEATFDAIAVPLIAAIEAKPIADGVLLSLHGNAMTQERFDVDADFVAQVRHFVGPGVPIGVTLDMHANVSPRLTAMADIVTIYRTTPHIDMHVRGRDTAALIHQMLRGELVPRSHLIHLPMVPSVEHQNTNHGPLAPLALSIEALTRRHGVASLDMSLGSAFADLPHLGMSVLCTTNGDEALASAVAGEIAQLAWAARSELCAGPCNSDQAVECLNVTSAPHTLLIDMGDNIFAGAEGASFELFWALERGGITGMIAPVHRPPLVEKAQLHPIGTRLPFDEAGFDFGTIIDIRLLTADTPSAVVAILETAAGNRIIACRDASIASNIAAILEAELVSNQTRVLIAKGDQRSITAAGRWADDTIWVGTSGETTPCLSELPYRTHKQPFLPRDPAASVKYSIE